MNYTINEIPDEATDANSGDYMVMWQGKTKKVSILNLLKTLVKKSEVTNTVSTTSDNVITSKAVSSLLTISASNTTITNAPPLQNGTTIRFFFTSQITGSDDTSAMSISYNGTSYSVKATSNGSLKDFTAYPIATEQTRGLKKGEKSEEEKGETKSGTRATVTTYVYCQAYTTLEMMFDGTQFIIMGNPVVISNSDYTVYTDGSITYTKTKVDDDFQHLCYIRVHGAAQINLETFLSYAKKTGMNGLKITYYNLGNDATKYTIVYATKYNDSWHLLEFSPSIYDFLISGNNLQCQALYPEQSDWTIEFWSGRNS